MQLENDKNEVNSNLESTVMNFDESLLQILTPKALKNLEIFEEKPDFEDVRFLAQTPPPPCVRMCPLLANPPSPLECGRPLWMAPYYFAVSFNCFLKFVPVAKTLSAHVIWLMNSRMLYK